MERPIQEAAENVSAAAQAVVQTAASIQTAAETANLILTRVDAALAKAQAFLENDLAKLGSLLDVILKLVP